MTPQLYYEAFTLGNYEEFKANQGNIRCAFNSAVSASHLADHYFVYNRKNEPQRVKGFDSIGDYVEHISVRTKGYFRDIRSIANAYKHLYTGDNKLYAHYSSVSSAGTVETVQFSGKEIKEISEIPRITNDAESTVIYTKMSGEQIEFMVALECVIKYWDGEINN